MDKNYLPGCVVGGVAGVLTGDGVLLGFLVGLGVFLTAGVAVSTGSQ